MGLCERFFQTCKRNTEKCQLWQKTHKRSSNIVRVFLDCPRGQQLSHNETNSSILAAGSQYPVGIQDLFLTLCAGIWKVATPEMIQLSSVVLLWVASDVTTCLFTWIKSTWQLHLFQDRGNCPKTFFFSFEFHFTPPPVTCYFSSLGEKQKRLFLLCGKIYLFTMRDQESKAFKASAGFQLQDHGHEKAFSIINKWLV